MIDVSAALTCFYQAITIERQNVTVDPITKRATFGTPTALPIQAVVQPATPQDLQLVSEGEYTEETLRMDTKVKLVTGLDDGAEAADKFIYQDWTYKLVARGDWVANGYYMYLANKVDLENKNG